MLTDNDLQQSIKVLALFSKSIANKNTFISNGFAKKALIPDTFS
jgi:hypothetical protein